HRLEYWAARIAQEAAVLEAVHGELEQAMDLLETTMDSHHRTGNHAALARTLAYVTVFFDRIQRPEVAATLYGLHGDNSWVLELPAVAEHLRSVLDETEFERCLSAARAMGESEA